MLCCDEDIKGGRTAHGPGQELGAAHFHLDGRGADGDTQPLARAALDPAPPPAGGVGVESSGRQDLELLA